ncbi:MAG: flavin reductase family protein [Acidimicrobiales bacterium]
MSDGPDAFDEARFRQVVGHFATGVTVITAEVDGEPTGFTAQSFTSLSLDPPLVTFFPGKDVASWPVIEAAGAFGVNILGEDQEALCRTFASKGTDKFEGVGWRPGRATGSPILEEGVAWLEARIEAVHDGGDHLIVVGRVADLDVGDGEHGPLLFYRGGFGRFES